MKKYLFIASAAVLFAACSSSNDNVNDIDDTQVPIGFTSAYLEKTTRNAGEMADKNALEVDGNTMQVWGWKYYTAEGASAATETKVFDGTVVTYTSTSTQATTKWVYSPIKFWDKAASYKFYGVAPKDVFSINETTKILSATSVPAIQTLFDNAGEDAVAADDTEAIDYLAADAIAREAGTKGNADDKDVAFTFKHILSKLTVSVKTIDYFNNTGSNYPQIKLRGLKIQLEGMCPTSTQKTAGTISPWKATTTDNVTTWTAGDSWSGIAATAQYYPCFNADGSTVKDLLLAKDAVPVAAYLVAPTALGETAPIAYTYKVTVDYDIYASATDVEPYQRVGVPVTGLDKFIQGTANTLTVTISNDPIFFDVESIDEWTIGQKGTVVVDPAY